MTQSHSNSSTGHLARRTFLQSLGVLGLGAVLAPPVRAASERLDPMQQVPVVYGVYAGVGDDPHFFGYPGAPTDFRGVDRDGVLFDASTLLKSPDGDVIHYDFHFTPDNSVVGQKKPYVMLHEGDGRYTSRAQVVTFDVEETPPQFVFLTPGTWRAVGRDVVQLDEKGGELDWALTRADFYRMGRGRPEYVVSLVYLIWREGFDGSSDPTNPPAVVADGGQALIEAGVQFGPTEF